MSRLPKAFSAAALAVMIAGPGLSACSDDSSECYTTGCPGSAQEERDIQRAAKWGCDDVEYKGLEGACG
ncbi:hypothetical protein [Nocardioides sp. MH1]|uniref:hypothetical protein n=1 Tax=Nocardioides sp. MH1 TaxID=3242490 RepID=UPI0035212876